MKYMWDLSCQTDPIRAVRNTYLLYLRIYVVRLRSTEAEAIRAIFLQDGTGRPTVCTVCCSSVCTSQPDAEKVLASGQRSRTGWHTAWHTAWHAACNPGDRHGNGCKCAGAVLVLYLLLQTMYEYEYRYFVGIILVLWFWGHALRGRPCNGASSGPVRFN